MPPLMQMPAYRIDNAELQTEPVVNALMQNRAYGLKQEQMGLERERTGMDRERLNMTRQSHEEARADAMKKRFGGQALLALQEPDEAKRAAIHQSIMSQHPEAGKLPDHYRNPNTGLLAILGDAGMADEYLRYQLQKQQDARAAAAEGRQAQMFPVQRESAQLDLEARKREIETPRMATADLQQGHALVFYDPRTGEETGRLSMGNDQQLGPYKDMNQRAGVEKDLRVEITTLSKDYRTVRDAAGSLEAIGKNDSAAGDIALIFSYMKILDPNSVVRETEFATAQNATGVPDRIRNIWNRVVDGQRLNPQQRQDFLNQARAIAGKQLGQYQRTIDQYSEVAKRLGVDPRNVVIDQELLSQDGGPAVGNSTIGTPANGDIPVLTPEQYKAAAPGTVFKTPDGRTLRKPAQAAR